LAAIHKRRFMRSNRIGAIAVPSAVVLIVGMLVIPMPTPLLDALISINICGAIIVLLMSMHVSRPLDFSVFPTLLLLATMFRLAINVSATRLILTHAYAGTVIQSFGHFVVGASIVVGLVIFLILIVIQFVVINNGAGRVAEVAARFTLDAMPGKQMAIDADLNAGIINADEARARRARISEEADFYGAMDGASKFVRGDAVAALVIVLINLVAGFIVGVAEHHLSFSSSIHRYSLLSVGDGLVSQIPALLLSISTGIVVTRTAGEDESDFGSDLIAQFTQQYRSLLMAGIALGVVGLIPGLPHVAFVVVGASLAIVADRARRIAQRRALEPPPPALPATPTELTPETLAGEMRVDALELELAFDLIDLVDPARGGDLLERVRGLRRKIAADKGIVIPPVRTRDNVNLESGHYVIRLHGVEVARGRAPAGHVLAIGEGIDDLPGEATREPVFGLPARWVPVEFRHLAVMSGVTVIDRSSVITTHLGEVVAANAGSLLSRQQLKQIIDVVKASDPVVVEEIGTVGIGLADIQRVLVDLLNEGVPIRDMVRILEAITERAKVAKDHDSLLDAVRTALGPTICSLYATEGVLSVITLDAALEHALADSLKPGEDGLVLTIDPAQAEVVVAETARLANEAEQQGKIPVLVCGARLRPALRKLLKAAAPRLGVLATTELAPQFRLERIGVVSPATAAAA
jgi:flagellar biosynthesis protein FlhA